MLPHGPEVRGNIYSIVQHNAFIYITNIVKNEERSISIEGVQGMKVLSADLEPIPYTKEQISIIVLRRPGVYDFNRSKKRFPTIAYPKS